MKTSTLHFLTSLQNNNNREWFNEHKNLYIEAREDVLQLAEQLINEIAEFDPELQKLDPKKAVFRIYRDTRFSLDKTPYKTNFGVNLGIGNAGKQAGYYLHIQPGASFLSGGIYMPEKDVLKRIRKEISLEAADFKKILEADEFRNYFRGLSVEHSLTRIPMGFEKDDPMAEYLKLKSFVVRHPISDKALLDAHAAPKFAKVYRAIKPLNDFLEQALA